MSQNQQSAVEQLWPLFGRPELSSAGGVVPGAAVEMPSASALLTGATAEVPSTSGVLSRATAAKHATATIVLHWSTVMAIVMAIAAIYLRDVTEDKVIRQVLLEAHRQLGLLVLICVPLRIAVRYWLGFSDQSGGTAALLRWAAAMTHFALYASLIALPLAGWAAVSAKGITLRLFGLVRLPGLVAPDPDVADALVDYHTWGAWALLALVAAHAVAALWHHFVRRDGVLRAMLPNSVPQGAERNRPLLAK